MAKSTKTFLCIFVTVSALGCTNDSDPRTCFVWGRITLDGEPIEEGEVTFLSDNGETRADSAAITLGEYKLHCTPGSKRVQIRAYREMSESSQKDSQFAANAHPREQFVPRRYNDDTELSSIVEPNQKNTIDFDLSM